MERPVFLTDGITRASGSNYVVELWAQTLGGDFKLATTTSLLTGAQAGLFQGGDRGNVEIPSVFCSGIVRVQVWDRTSGTNFDTAGIRAAETFMQTFGGMCCDPPCVPEEMEGFTSMCLGQGECNPLPTTIGFGMGWAGVVVVSETAGGATIAVRRTGELGRTNAVTYGTGDGTALEGADYVGQKGTLTFLPLEMSKSFTVGVLQTTHSQPKTVRLKLIDPSPGVRLAPDEGTLWILHRGGAPLIKMIDARTHAIWVSSSPGANLYVEGSTNLAATNWQVVGWIDAGWDYDHTGIAAGAGQDWSDFPYRFYRAVVR